MDFKSQIQGQPLDSLEKHAHVCLFYSSSDEVFHSSARYLRGASQRGEGTVYVADDHSRDQVASGLRGQGFDPSRAGLRLITKKEAHLRDGHFTPERMIEFWEETAAKITGGGQSGVRAVAEMTWSLGPEKGVERLTEFEAKLNEVFPRIEGSVLCAYNLNRFGPEVVEDMIRVHPQVLYGGKVMTNPYYMPPEAFLAGVRRWYKLEDMLSSFGMPASHRIPLATVKTHGPTATPPG